MSSKLNYLAIIDILPEDGEGKRDIQRYIISVSKKEKIYHLIDSVFPSEGKIIHSEILPIPREEFRERYFLRRALEEYIVLRCPEFDPQEKEDILEEMGFLYYKESAMILPMGIYRPLDLLQQNRYLICRSGRSEGRQLRILSVGQGRRGIEIARKHLDSYLSFDGATQWSYRWIGGDAEAEIRASLFPIGKRYELVDTLGYDGGRAKVILVSPDGGDSWCRTKAIREYQRLIEDGQSGDILIIAEAK